MITGLSHLTFSVADLERSFRFYVEALGFRPVARWYKGAYLSAGELWLCLALDEEAGGAIAGKGYSHVAFSVLQEEFGLVRGRLIEAGARIWQENRSEGDSFYFLDPDGQKLEIHVGNLESRIGALKEKAPRSLAVFDEAGDHSL